MKGFTRTRRHKEGAIDGLNLFFGALLGANLGTFQGLKVVHYVTMIGLLAGMVIVLRLVSVSEDRRRPLLLLAVYALLLMAIAVFPDFRPAGLSLENLHKLIGTMAVWVMLGVAIELSPVQPETRTEIADEHA